MTFAGDFPRSSLRPVTKAHAEDIGRESRLVRSHQSFSEGPWTSSLSQTVESRSRLFAVRRDSNVARRLASPPFWIAIFVSLCPDRLNCVHLDFGRVLHTGSAEGELHIVNTGKVEFPFKILLDQVMKLAVLFGPWPRTLLLPRGSSMQETQVTARYCKDHLSCNMGPLKPQEQLVSRSSSSCSVLLMANRKKRSEPFKSAATNRQLHVFIRQIKQQCQRAIPGTHCEWPVPSSREKDGMSSANVQHL